MNRKELASFFSKVHRVELTGCWLWVGGIVRGYGQFVFRGRPRIAHRVAYQAFVGDVPDGLELDHRCMDKRCVNPSHLQAVTHLENMRRYHSMMLVCRNGHDKTPENRAVDVVHGKPQPFCRVCRAERRRRSSTRTRIEPAHEAVH